MKCLVAILGFTVLLVSCNSSSKTPQKDFKLQIVTSKKERKQQRTLQFSIKSKNQQTIDSVSVQLNGLNVPVLKEASNYNVVLNTQKVGEATLEVTVFSPNKQSLLTHTIVVLAPLPPKLYSYTVLEKYPHDSNAYTQGLEFYKDTLYESIGQYGKSAIRKVSYQNGQVFLNSPLRANYFGEGLTFWKDSLLQLTWKENTGFVYKPETLEKIGEFSYQKSKEGWGLCASDEKIYKSDGTEKIWILNPKTLKEETAISLYTHTSKIQSVNELEWVEGKIYANIYQKNALAIVNPNSGVVEGVVDLNGLQEQVMQHAKLDVLNGIAYKGEKNILYVTGKNWDALFKIKIQEK